MHVFHAVPVQMLALSVLSARVKLLTRSTLMPAYHAELVLTLVLFRLLQTKKHKQQSGKETASLFEREAVFLISYNYSMEAYIHDR